MDAVKLEGGTPARAEAARACVAAGIAVMGHVGLTPQVSFCHHSLALFYSSLTLLFSAPLASTTAF